MADLHEQLVSGLADRYRIERELGRGGMATVFLAEDLRHDRPVALKVLHPDLAHALGPERFQREIKLAARLQHPHILSVHDSGEAAGQLWFTMPFVEGESLRDRLLREKQLPIDDAVRIAREAAEALDYAHRHGVIHRDIKPENILLSEGHALVADFGIGRALGVPAPGEKLTETGMVVGTPAYMSPEQGAGERALDGRTDIYSLGVVLYEMLAGEPPYTGPTAQAILARRFTGEIPRVRQVRPSVPEAVEQTLTRTLAPVPADRFSSATEFARALVVPTTGATAAPTRLATPVSGTAPAPGAVAPPGRQPRRLPHAAITMGLGFLIGLGLLFAWRRTHPAGDAGGKLVAVLPFENLGRPEDEYFADGVTDAVRGKLATFPRLQVIASRSASEYKKTSKSLPQIARELGVDYLLIAKIRWAKGESGGSRVEVSPELVDVSSGRAPTTKWQQSFDASLTDVFQVQADIAGRVAQALDLALGAAQRQALAERPTANVAAYDAYLKGNETAGGLITATPADLRQAIGYYERAIALDPGFALAWAQLSRAHSAVAPPSAADARESHAAASRALALAPNLPQGHLALGDFYNNIERDWSRALAEYTAGRRHAANDADLLTGIALVERAQGHFQESMGSLRQALILDPRSASTARRLAHALLWLRRYPEAMQAAEQALALNPGSIDLNETKAMILLAQGDLAGARAVLKTATAQADPTELVAYVGTYWDLVWVLDDAQQQLLLRLPPAAFDDDRAAWGIVLAQTYHVRNDAKKARAYADSSRMAYEEQLKTAPDDPQAHAIYGLALAYLGRRAEALREGERSLALLPITKDAYQGTYDQHQLVRVYLLAGEPEKALDQLEPLLKIPYYLSPEWLKIDPTFDPLRGNPRFERLVTGG